MVYYRQVVDDIGKDMMQKELDKLQYGNCDISDWEGRLNTNNNNRTLTGFWIQSSLLISPKEQVEVMEQNGFLRKVQQEISIIVYALEEQTVWTYPARWQKK